jgi:hypothetical protein
MAPVRVMARSYDDLSFYPRLKNIFVAKKTGRLKPTSPVFCA